MIQRARVMVYFELIGTALQAAGALWLALNLPSSSFTFPVMLIGATLWMIVAYIERRMSIFWLNLVFTAINIVGIWRWWQ